MTITVARQCISFLLDTGATYSILCSFKGPTICSNISIVGVCGSPYQPLITPPLHCVLHNSTFTHRFLVLPQCPTPLISRDLLHKLNTAITFNPSAHLKPNSSVILLLTLKPSPPSPSVFPLPPDLINPQVWDTANPSITKCSPVQIKLVNPTSFPSQSQYPLPTCSLLALQLIIKDLLKKQLIRPTNSPYNTPILAVKKPNGAYRLVQDLHLIHSAVVPTPYTLLSSIPTATTHFSVIDLKEAFFSIPLHPNSQNLFAFTWTDPVTLHSTQLT